MQIERVESDLYHVPLAVPLSDSIHGEMPYFELITCRVRTEDGLEGLGYTYTCGHGGAAVRELLRRELAPALVGRDARCTEALWQRMWWAIHWGGRGGPCSLAVSAADIALWDLRGKAAGEPLWRLLGGARNRVPAYAGGVDLEFPLEQLQDQMRGFLAQGFHTVKMKTGRARLREDVERVAAIRELIGPDITLMVDCNTIWSVDKAMRAAQQMREFDLYWMEEPTAPEDIDGHVRLQREGGIPIATGENLHTLNDFFQMIKAGAVQFPQVDVTQMGGVTVFLKVAHLAEAHNLQVTSHGVHDIQVHLLAAVPNGGYLEIHGFALDEYLEHPFVLDHGDGIAPDRPGHGVRLDFGKLAQHRVE